MLQNNVRVTTFTVSELLRESQQGAVVKLPPPPPHTHTHTHPDQIKVKTLNLEQ